MIPVLRHETDVQFARIAPGGFTILSALVQAARVVGEDLWITSGTDSHATGRHPLGEAFDVRTRDLSPGTVMQLKTTAETLLGPRFTVLYEVPTMPSDFMLAHIATVNPHATGPHLHLQVRKGTTYPPPEGELVA